MTSRRRFMLYSGAVALSTGVAVITGSQQKGLAKTSLSSVASSRSVSTSSTALHLKDFQPLQHQTFTLHKPDGQHVKLQLSQVTDLPVDQHLEQFQLRFMGAHDADIEQGIYQLEHPKLGTLDLLVVPEQAVGRGSQYFNVTFNHLLA